jgi:type I restriction enzyme S subunit
LVFNRTSEIGDEVGLAATYLGTECVVFGGFVIRARPVTKRIDSSFAAYAMRAPDVRTQIIAMGQGAVRANIGQDNLRRVELKFPPLSEQLAIATALADADALIDSLEQLLTKKRQIKQGAMQELLTGQRRLPGFEAPWTDGVLGDVVAELVAGVSVNSDPTGGGEGVPSVVKTSALKGGVFYPSECKPIVQADLARATTPLRRDTLLISRMNTPDLVGEVGYVDRAFDWLYLPDRVWMTRMRAPDCVCVRWLGYLLSSAPYKRLIGDTATGTSGSMKNIAKSGLLGLPLRFPEVDEQRAIAAGLADMAAEITALESRLTKARALKQAMAQALLTGRIRLVEPRA